MKMICEDVVRFCADRHNNDFHFQIVSILFHFASFCRDKCNWKHSKLDPRDPSYQEKLFVIIFEVLCFSSTCEITHALWSILGMLKLSRKCLFFLATGSFLPVIFGLNLSFLCYTYGKKCSVLYHVQNEGWGYEASVKKHMEQIFKFPFCCWVSGFGVCHSK